MEDYFVSLDDWIEIKISGSQTMEYLNGIITKDLNQIEDNQMVRAAFLNPKAKIRSIFWIKKEQNIFYLYTSGFYKQNLIEDLLKYKLSMDVKLEDITEETDPLYLISSNQSIPGLSSDGINFELRNLAASPEGNMLSYDQFHDLMVKHHITPIELLAGENPYEAGIDDTISLEKGCFLGQEPISRMYHRGNPRKYIYAIKSKNTVDTGELLKNEEAVGQILTVVEDDGNYVGLAYIRRTVDDFDGIYQDGNQIDVVTRVGTYPENER